MLLISLVNLIWIGFLVKIYISVKNNPRQYDTPSGYSKYCDSGWYWPPRKEHHKGDPPDLSTDYPMGFLCGGFLYYFLSSVYVYALSIPKGVGTIRFIGSGTWILFSYLLYALYASLMAFYLPLFFNSPKAICFCSFHIYPKVPRSDAIRIITKYVLIATIIVLPFRVLALCNRGYANQKEIVYSPYWSLTEQHFVYDKLRNVSVEYDSKQIAHYIIINEAGQKFDLTGKYVSFDGLRGEILEEIIPLLPEKITNTINMDQKFQDAIDNQNTGDDSALSPDR